MKAHLLLAGFTLFLALGQCQKLSNEVLESTGSKSNIKLSPKEQNLEGSQSNPTPIPEVEETTTFKFPELHNTTFGWPTLSHDNKTTPKPKNTTTAFTWPPLHSTTHFTWPPLHSNGTTSSPTTWEQDLVPIIVGAYLIISWKSPESDDSYQVWKLPCAMAFFTEH